MFAPEPLSWPEGDCSLCKCSADGRTQTCVTSCNLTPEMCEEGKVLVQGDEGEKFEVF